MGNTMMKRFATTGAFLLSSLISFNLAAAEASPEEQAASAIANRQAVFKLLSFANAPLGGMARGGAYDAEVAIKGTERVAMLAAMIPELFAANTVGNPNPNAGRYAAADTIWDNKADFDKLAADLVAGAEEALSILNTQGEAGVRAAVAAIGPKCGACHDRFRVER
jgi:cytochrome c556